MTEPFILKKEKVDPSKFIYTFEINVNTDMYLDTYLFKGTEEEVKDKFNQLVEIEKNRFKNKIKFRNHLSDLTKK